MPLTEAARRNADPYTAGKRRSADVIMSLGLPGMEVPSLVYSSIAQPS
jgi:hypothetical protein